MTFNPFSALTSKIFGGALVAALVAFAFVAWRADSISEARDRIAKERDALQTELNLSRLDTALKETAAVERQGDMAAVADMEKDLSNAIKDTPDAPPSDVRVRLGCERLRRAGYLDADLPVQCRSGG